MCELVACNRQREAAREQILKSNNKTTNTMKNIYTEKPWWPSCHYDGRRKKYFLNKSMEEFESDKQKHFQRQQMRWITDNLEKSRFRKVKSDLAYFSEIPYEYQGDGLDDFNKYQRPASNGIGWVAICPGERGNNYYVDDPVTVAILKKRYNNKK